MKWAFVLLFVALPAWAQSLPEWRHTSINDFAGLLTPEDTRVLDEALIALHAQTGVEGTVVTLADRARHGGTDGLESFATRLFNHWGVGDATRNDGFMVLVLADDREARIELGAGYPAGADTVAAQIMARDMLPDFRAGRMSEGIRNGTLQVIERIAHPHADGQAPKRQRDPLGWLFGAGFLGVFGLIAVNLIRNLLHQRAPRSCPQCGGGGLIEHEEFGGDAAAPRTVWSSCPSCGWRGGRMSRRGNRGERSPRGGGFGGGRSSGGGASGRW